MPGIQGIGIDLVENTRVEKTWRRFGQRFAERILDPIELEQIRHTRHPARFLAMRFAAKEAGSKAIGTGFKQGVAPRQFGVRHRPSGEPYLIPNGRAAEIIAEREINAIHLSLTDEGGFSVAFVVVSRK